MKELTEALKKNVIFGSDRVLKLLKNDKMSKVFLSKNCPSEVKNEVNHNSKLFKVEVIELEMKNNEVGAFCKKPFSVSVLGLER
jgi:ribosomal protein L30E